MRFFSEWVIRLRIPIILFFVGVTVFFATRMPDAQVDGEMKSSLPADMPSRLSLDRMEKMFGGTEMALIVMEADDVLAESTLKRLKGISDDLEKLPEVDKVLSLFTLKDIHGDGGEMYVDSAVGDIPVTSEDREALRQRLLDNDLVMGGVVSKEFHAVAAIGMLRANAKDFETMKHLEEVAARNPGPEKLHLAGLPVIRVQVAHDIQTDMKRFLPVGLLIMLLFLFACFRQIRGVVLPFVVVVMAIAVALGTIPLMGWKIHVITVLLPVVLIAVANDYGIHLIARYQEINGPGNPHSSKDLARMVVQDLSAPVVLAGVTTMAGLLCLMTHIIIPAKQLGILAALGVLFALVSSLTFLPALLSFLPKPKPVKGLADEDNRRPGPLHRLLIRTADVVVSYTRRVLLAIVLFTLVASVGIAWVRVDTNPIHYYSPENPLYQSSVLVDKEFGGSTTVSVLVTGSIKEPAVLKEIDGLEQRLKALPMVGDTTSIARVVKRMNRAFNDDNPEYEKIPDTLEEVAELFLTYEFSGDPEDFERMVDIPYENALLTVRVNSASTEDIKTVVGFIEEEVRQRPDGAVKEASGFGKLLADLADAVVRGQVWSLLLSLLVVGFLVAVLFRSFTAGLTTAIPLGLALILLFGMMGWFNFELNIATVMLSSIMIGVGIDYTIHFLWRYREERAAGFLQAEAVSRTLTTTGRGIVFNALSVVVGFGILLVSSFVPVKFFGALVMVTILTCLTGALVLLPAVILLKEPGFLKPRNAGKVLNGQGGEK